MTCEETDQDLCQRICPGIRVPRKCKFQGCPPPEIPESSEVFGERTNYSKKANLLLKEMFLIKGNAEEETLVSMHPAILKHTPAFSLGIISMMASANTIRHLYESCQTRVITVETWSASLTSKLKDLGDINKFLNFIGINDFSEQGTYLEKTRPREEKEYMNFPVGL